MRAGRHGGFSGFTLIELLVVIAIIGLLLAVLVPALGMAKEQAEVVCRAHLHQWGLIFSTWRIMTTDSCRGSTRTGTRGGTRGFTR